jgi:hypothetical protein
MAICYKEKAVVDHKEINRYYTVVDSFNNEQSGKFINKKYLMMIDYYNIRTGNLP